ncbi:HAD superfamily hydrolase (TIGR01450 family) [Umboniibacter marinipuniceus]|uniref:HAD superfamily hydrolase (TIGR01450 family) n=1 Tax=Umboniibacter marinipuniceus TaxID=569599 RepID=A0A3M0A8C2_9GAMM|nr:HAD superfamily hydrolase (TIGR01450 family) [Umboniibacter marinipuniceus]
MLGVILAAGVGSRLRPMTNLKPKCLVSCAGKPILDYQLDAYRVAGIKRVIIVVGYEGQAIREHVKHIKDLSIEIVANDDYEITNNMYSLYLVKRFINGEAFVLNNADLAVDDNVVKALLEDPRDNLIAVDVGRYDEESMKVTCLDDGRISDISKQIGPEKAVGCSIDFYKFSDNASSTLFAEIDRVVEVEENLKDWTEVAMQRLFQAQGLAAEVCDVSALDWVEIDNYEDLQRADSLFSQRTRSIADYEAYVFDLDGTLYVGSETVEDGDLAVQRLRDAGKSVYFMSNNSSKAVIDYQNRLATMGINADESEIILSSQLVIQELLARSVEKVFVLGTVSLKKAVLDAGIEICTNDPEYVVVGYDTELAYSKLIDACRLINRGVDYVCTHPDVFCPSEHGPIPDIGALTVMLQATTGKAPTEVFGKPNTVMVANLVDKYGADQILMIGDRLHTDIAMAEAAGLGSLLVLTGEASREDLEDSSVKPNYVEPSVRAILA